MTYTFTGHVHSVNAAGVERVAGTLRQTVEFGTGPTYSCTTDDLYWSATRDQQGSQAFAPPPAGAYSGSSGGFTLTYSASDDSTQLQNISVSTTGTDGSFTAHTTQSGTVLSVPATFTYTIIGHVHGLSATGAARTAGTSREDIAFDNDTAYSCTTDDLYRSATI